MKPALSRADTRAEYRRIIGHLEFSSGASLFKFLGCLLAAGVIAMLPSYPGLSEAGRWTLAIISFCGLLWMTEAIPAFAVALLGIGLQIVFLGSPGGVLFGEGDARAWEQPSDGSQYPSPRSGRGS